MTAPKEVIEILADYDVRVDDVVRQNEITFWIEDKRLSYRYDPWQPDLDDLRRKLQNFGATLKVSASTITTIATPSTDEQVEEPQSQAPSPPLVTNRDGYTVYRSAKVIAVELAADLTIRKGHMLVVPLNRPNTLLDMTRDQFLVLFEATAEKPDDVAPPVERRSPPPPPPPVTRAPATVHDDENDVLAYLMQRKGGVKVRVIADALGMTLKATEGILKHLSTQRTVELEDGFWHLTARPTVQMRQPVKAGRKSDRTKRVVRIHPSSRSGLPAQVGRLLAAMAYVTKTSGRADLTVSDVTPWLIERDQRQFSARMPGAMKAGWVKRGLPLPAPFTRGWYYQITPEGLAAVLAAGNWMFEYDGETTPDWLSKIAS